MMRLKNRQGMGLIEVLGALTLSVIALTALVSMVIYALRSSLQSQLLMEGTELVSRQLELVRINRDQSTWDAFKADMGGCDSATSKCIITCANILSDPCTVSAPANLPEQNGITVSFMASDAETAGSIEPATEVVRITSMATWNAGKTKSTSVTTDFSNWQGF